jgi:hypothetical protein
LLWGIWACGSSRRDWRVSTLIYVLNFDIRLRCGWIVWFVDVVIELMATSLLQLALMQRLKARSKQLTHCYQRRIYPDFMGSSSFRSLSFCNNRANSLCGIFGFSYIRTAGLHPVAPWSKSSWIVASFPDWPNARWRGVLPPLSIALTDYPAPWSRSSGIMVLFLSWANTRWRGVLPPLSIALTDYPAPWSRSSWIIVLFPNWPNTR